MSGTLELNSDPWLREKSRAKLSAFQKLTIWVDGLIGAYRWAIPFAFSLALIAAHYWLLGFSTWDGLSYRISPIVELVQNGSLGGWKFNYPAAQHFTPFLELVHLPFLKLLGLRGLYFSFSLILLPLSFAAVFAFIRELTQDVRWATYGALTFLAIPFVNAQPFSGYIDFAVIGAFAFFLYAGIRVLRMEHPSIGSLALLSVATFVFTMSRQQAPYLALLFFVVLPLLFFHAQLHLDGRENNFDRGRIPKLILFFAIGIAPAAALHISRLIAYGSPIYPYQFDLFGITSSAGLTSEYTVAGAGLVDRSWSGLVSGFVKGWVWPTEWPGSFYDSRIMGVGLLFWLFLLSLPLIAKVINRRIALLLIVFVAIAVASQDFWLPRWSMTLVLVLIVGIGGALSYAARKKSFLLFAPVLIAVALHLARPVYDVVAMTSLGHTYNRVNISSSPTFIGDDFANGELQMYPDLDADFVVVHPLINEFSLLLYGQNLTNEIVGVAKVEDFSELCSATQMTSPVRRLLVVDQTGLLDQTASGCRWVCEYSALGLCQAGMLIPAN